MSEKTVEAQAEWSVGAWYNEHPITPDGWDGPPLPPQWEVHVTAQLPDGTRWVGMGVMDDPTVESLLTDPLSGMGSVGDTMMLALWSAVDAIARQTNHLCPPATVMVLAETLKEKVNSHVT